MKHCTREELELYRNGQMSILSRIACSSHLRGCEKCSAVMAELKDDDLLISDLRSSIQLYQEISEEDSICRTVSIRN